MVRALRSGKAPPASLGDDGKPARCWQKPSQTQAGPRNQRPVKQPRVGRAWGRRFGACFAQQKIPVAFATTGINHVPTGPVPRMAGIYETRALPGRRATAQFSPAGLLAPGSSPHPRLPIHLGQWHSASGYPVTVAPPQRIYTAFPFRARFAGAPDWLA